MVAQTTQTDQDQAEQQQTLGARQRAPNASPPANHLLLLVGGNPLPNAVAAVLLGVPRETTITLLHSERGLPTANRLQTWLRDKQGFAEPRLQQVAEADPVCIARGVEAALKAVNAPYVGLHYTGGTKAMSVHASLAAREVLAGSGTHLTCTYLDPRTLSVVTDPDKPLSGQGGGAARVGNRVQLSLDDLLNLHGHRFDPKKPADRGRPNPPLPSTAQALLQVYAGQGAGEKWRAWKRVELYPKCQNKYGRLLTDAQLRGVSLSLPSDSDPVLAPVRGALRRELNLTGNGLVIGAAAQRIGGSPKDFYTWLDGSWLESATLQALRDVSEHHRLHDVRMSIKPDGRDFELDVVAVQHYQLFAVSCGTSVKKDELKLKLFEAHTRARQLGGDEARVALICPHGQPHVLEDEVRRDIDEEGRIRVFGHRHLSDLSTHLSDWIAQNQASPTAAQPVPTPAPHNQAP